MKLPPAPSASSASVRAVMQSNRSTGTKPEVALRSALHATGLRFRKNLRIEACDCRVRPDIVFTKRRVAVFVDGCFWHGCPEHGNLPRVNRQYWKAKLDRNLERDADVTVALRQSGWNVVRLWEHTRVEEGVHLVAAALKG